MKLSDLIKVDTLDAVEVAASRARRLLSKADWQNEDCKFNAQAENAVYELWKIDHGMAQSMWEESFKEAPAGVTPSFIRRRALEEGIPA